MIFWSNLPFVYTFILTRENKESLNIIKAKFDIPIINYDKEFFKKYKFLVINFWQYGAHPQEIGTIIKFLQFSKFNTKFSNLISI